MRQLVCYSGRRTTLWCQLSKSIFHCLKSQGCTTVFPNQMVWLLSIREKNVNSVNMKFAFTASLFDRAPRYLDETALTTVCTMYFDLINCLMLKSFILIEFSFITYSLKKNVRKLNAFPNYSRCYRIWMRWIWFNFNFVCLTYLLKRKINLVVFAFSLLLNTNDKILFSKCW